MKNAVYLTVITLSVFACKTPTYHYVSPTLNNTAYNAAGEGQLGIQFGSVGIGGKGGIALTKNINLNAWAGIFPEAEGGYNSRESEFSIGFQTNPRNNTATSFYVGLGNGNNEKDKIGLAGNFNRPFVQVQWSAFDKPLGSARYDGCIGFRVNKLYYNGTKNGQTFHDNPFYYEPYFGGSIGGENVRLEIIQGFTFKNAGEWGEGVRVFPWFGNVGVTVKFRKREK